MASSSIQSLPGLQDGLMRQLQREKKVIFPNLKFTNVYRSESITMFPSVSGVPNLEWLGLSCCFSLVEVNQSVFLHGKIIYLNLSDCHSLEILSSCIKMKSLQRLLLYDCKGLKRFPEFSTYMERLSVLHIHSCCSTRASPSSIRLLTGLTSLIMGSCFGVRFEQEVDNSMLPNMIIQGSLHLSSLRVLDLSQNLLDDSFPSSLHTAWPSLEEFNLSNNKFTRLPATISHLKHLDLKYCNRLKELPELPSLIQVLKADDCTSLEKIGDLSNTYKWLFMISFVGCRELLKDGESQSHIANMLMKSLVQKCAAVNHRLSIMVPGTRFPNWFNNRRFGHEIELHLPHNQISKVTGLAMCCRLSSYSASPLTISFKPSYEGNLIGSSANSSEGVGSTWVGYLPVEILGNLCHGFEYENLIISFDNYKVVAFNVVECGVCVVYKDDIRPMRGTESWISDYDELGMIGHYSASEEVQHGRWSFPDFFFNHGKASNHNSVTVR